MAQELTELAQTLGYNEIDTRTFALLSAFKRWLGQTQPDDLSRAFLSFEENHFDLNLLENCELPREATGLEPFMSRELELARPHQKISEVAPRLVERMITGMPVVDDSGLVGVISNTDLACLLARPELRERWSEVTVAELMTTRVQKVPLNSRLQDVMRLMLSHRVHRVMVVDPADGSLRGIITALDCVKILEKLVESLDLKVKLGWNPYSSSDAVVLIVDDVPDNIHLLKDALKSRCGKLLAATNGLQALQRATQTPHPDLILLDISMPEMDGYEVLKRLQDNPQTARIPVIFVTALDDVGSEERGLSLGAVDYITKPFNPDLVRARVCNHLELHRYRLNLEQELAQRSKELALASSESPTGD